MSSANIAFAEAVALATQQARSVLREFFPKNEAEVFEDYVLEDKNFWLFFRNRNIVLPNYADSGISDWAFAIGKHGMILLVRDNLECKDELDRQAEGLSGYFEKRELR